MIFIKNLIKDLKVTDTTNFGIQRKIVANMTTESWERIPHAVFTYRPDVSKFLNEYELMAFDKNRTKKITLNTLMLKVIVEGIKAAPQINGHIEYNRHLVRGEVRQIENINISMPWLLPSGEMMTINLKNFENKSLEEMANYIENVAKKIENTNFTEVMFEVSMDNTITTLKQGNIFTPICRLIGSKTGKHKIITLRGRERQNYYKIPEKHRLTKSDIEQGTITVSNIGSIYKEHRGEINLMEIIPPQLVAIGLSAVQEQPGICVSSNGEKYVDIIKVMPITIAFDHRALDFGDVIPFLKRLDDIFENPKPIHSW